MCARCLKEGMFIPKTRRGKRPNSSAEKIVTADSNICAPTIILSASESDVDRNNQTSSILALPTEYFVPDLYYSSSEGEEIKQSSFPFVVGIVVTISLILALFGRRLGE